MVPMSDPENSVSPPGDSSSSQIKQQSYATVVNKRPALKKHDFEVSFVDGVPTIEVPSEVISDSVPLWEDSWLVDSLLLLHMLQKSMSLLIRFGL